MNIKLNMYNGILLNRLCILQCKPKYCAQDKYKPNNITKSKVLKYLQLTWVFRRKFQKLCILYNYPTVIS